MLGNNILKKLTTAFTAVAILCVYSTAALAIPTDSTGEISVTGQVTVNGQTAVSSGTIISGSTIATGAGSSATISLGKLGRVEVLENSNLTLNFSPAGIVAIVSSGKVRVANSVGVPATVTTKDATMMADAGQANNFLVETECSHTHLDTTSGMVVMREGTSDRQVAAGTSATAGNLAQTGCEPCLRPDSAPPVGIAGWPWLLLIPIGVAAAVLLGKKGDRESGGDVIIVSPTR